MAVRERQQRCPDRRSVPALKSGRTFLRLPVIVPKLTAEAVAGVTMLPRG